MRPRRPRSITATARFLAGALLFSLSVLAQEAGASGPADPADPAAAALEAIRAAWLLPAGEVKDLFESAPLSPAEFAVAGMVSHHEGIPLAAVVDSERKLGSWTAVLLRTQGALHDTVFRENPRYPLDSPPPGEGASPPNCDARIVELAEVMTLERLTARSPAALVKELGERPFEALLAQARPEAQSAPKGAPGSDRRRGGAPGAHEGPPGAPRPDDRPGEVRGWVGS
jgi:hypothetical protein